MSNINDSNSNSALLIYMKHFNLQSVSEATRRHISSSLLSGHFRLSRYLRLFSTLLHIFHFFFRFVCCTSYLLLGANNPATYCGGCAITLYST